ncbi:Itaconate transport protein [Lachnellula suecica]|uniref:Itaconate transport protein n=1 Tax=Lachnellula suecica TaxID=602035 RepID=A0A8T9BWR4_9HELO|nr:Itaconate transport protein [Lachnellula suecica]
MARKMPDSIAINSRKDPITLNEKDVDESALETISHHGQPPPLPYTMFTRPQKRGIGFVLTLTMIASPLTATIYLPLLPLLSAHFHVSEQSINLTITVYIIFQAIAPLLFATASDTVGRRPIYLATYALYTVASLGLALNRSSYPALLILRALQSLGASAVLAVAYGVVADVCVPAERGAMQGPMMGAANLAVCIGPIIGGWVALGSGGYEWVFWALVMFGGSVFALVGFFLPETARVVVGNGSISPKKWRRTWWVLVKERSHATTLSLQNTRLEQEKLPKIGEKKKFRIPNPLDALRIIFWKDTGLVLWMAASPYAIYYCIQTSIPGIYKDIYGFNELKIGLSYLTGGAGVVIGGYLNGKLMDYNYKVTACSIGHTINKVYGDDLDNFPIERARARGCWYLLAAYIGALAGFGWSVQERAHESVPMIMQFLLGALCTCFQQTFNCLLVDIFPASPSTAAAAGNITRCALSAVAVAVMQPLVGIMGRGWFFTTLAIISGGGGLVANFVLLKWGMKWRRGRLAKTRKKQCKQSNEGSIHEDAAN